MATLTSLRQLQYLVTLSDNLNFTRAAEACRVTQSTLRVGLRELEGVLAARLVERDRQNVMMTPIGIEVAKRARAILVATQDLVEHCGCRDPKRRQPRARASPANRP